MECPRHGRLCGFAGDELERCPVCHITWAKVEAAGREHHEAEHADDDAQRVRAMARRAVWRVEARRDGAGA